jgi:hypothetical protein
LAEEVTFGIDNLYVVDDEYLTTENAKFTSIAQRAQKEWNDFLTIIGNLKTDGVLEGNHQEKLEELSVLLKETIQTRLVDSSEAVQEVLDSYIPAIDEADQCLY